MQTDAFQAVRGLPWHLLLTFLMIALTILMVSNVHYHTCARRLPFRARPLG